MSLRVLSTPLAGSSLTQLALSGADTQWFVARPQSADEWRARGELIRASLIDADWLSRLGPAFGPAGPGERVERAAASGFIVTTGQQPGLFGGPLYTWWKAFSALAVANALQDRTGLPVAPVFWAATDDSDFAESAVTVVATADGAEQLVMPPPPDVGGSLAHVPIGDLSAQLSRLEAAAGSASSAGIMALVRKAYSPGATVGGAYVDLVRAILEPLGVAVLDAAHQAVRSLAHPLLIQSLRQSAGIEAALASRAAELDAMGHSAQVKNVAGRTLVFGEEGGRRERLRTRDAGAATAAEPGSLGPNVLLRPIVERSILPTVAYVGGPAEISYFAQVTAVAEALDVPPPLVVPRWSGMVIEPRVARILEQYDLDADDFRDPHAVETRMARSSLPDDLKAGIAALRETFTRTTRGLASADGADLAPPTVLQGLDRNVTHRIDRLERRYAAGMKRRGNDALRDASIARGALYPFGDPQERALNFMPLVARYGQDLMSLVLAEIRLHAARIV